MPDWHAPFGHPDALKFLTAVKERYLDKRSLIINLGDEVDGNQISFHEKDPDVPFSPCKELEQAIDDIKEMEEIFPRMYLCTSNHGSLVYRRSKHAGLPRHYIKSYNEILGVKRWEWHDEIIIDTHLGPTYFCHGKSGRVGKLAKDLGCNAIQGHFHSLFHINWYHTPLKQIFDAHVGCLIDHQSIAFAYGKNHLPKPILGCMVISKQGYPRLIKMLLNKKNRWIGELP